MNFRSITATALSAAAAAATAFGIAPAQAQFYGYGNGWRQPIESRPFITTTYSGMIYRSNYPVMQQPNFGQPLRINNPGRFGYSSGSYFGW